MKIEIECLCGRTIEPSNNITIHDEDVTGMTVECPQCGYLYRINVQVDFKGPRS